MLAANFCLEHIPKHLTTTTFIQRLIVVITIIIIFYPETAYRLVLVSFSLYVIYSLSVFILLHIYHIHNTIYYMNYNGFIEKFIFSVNFDVVILHNEQITSFSLVYIIWSEVDVVNYMIWTHYVNIARTLPKETVELYFIHHIMVLETFSTIYGIRFHISNIIRLHIKYNVSCVAINIRLLLFVILNISKHTFIYTK